MDEGLGNLPEARAFSGLRHVHVTVDIYRRLADVTLFKAECEIKAQHYHPFSDSLRFASEKRMCRLINVNLACLHLILQGNNMTNFINEMGCLKIYAVHGCQCRLNR